MRRIHTDRDIRPGKHSLVLETDMLRIPINSTVIQCHYPLEDRFCDSFIFPEKAGELKGRFKYMYLKPESATWVKTCLVQRVRDTFYCLTPGVGGPWALG